MVDQGVGIIALADGTFYEGISVGIKGHLCGELVFNTAQTGYQEIMTDPSYKDQIIVFTQPHIGNVGVNTLDNESDEVHAKGMILHRLSKIASNWRSEKNLPDFFKEKNVIAISDIDTRALTQVLRDKGSQAACLMTDEIDVEKAIKFAKLHADMKGKNLAESVGTQETYVLNNLGSSKHHIVVLDFGVKKNILNNLLKEKCKVTVVPANLDATQILALKPNGILLSNGPGDPAACEDIIKTIQFLLSKNIPIMGICLGHQLLALASGAITQKMAFGHHGANHPIKCLNTGLTAISSQNHNFVVSDDKLPACLEVTHRSLFDGSIAGIIRTDVPAFGFQGHPEASPGPNELSILFKQFISMIEATYAKTN